MNARGGRWWRRRPCGRAISNESGAEMSAWGVAGPTSDKPHRRAEMVGISMSEMAQESGKAAYRNEVVVKEGGKPDNYGAQNARSAPLRTHPPPVESLTGQNAAPTKRVSTRGRRTRTRGDSLDCGAMYKERLQGLVEGHVDSVEGSGDGHRARVSRRSSTWARRARPGDQKGLERGSEGGEGEGGACAGGTLTRVPARPPSLFLLSARGSPGASLSRTQPINWAEREPRAPGIAQSPAGDSDGRGRTRERCTTFCCAHGTVGTCRLRAHARGRGFVAPSGAIRSPGRARGIRGRAPPPSR